MGTIIHNALLITTDGEGVFAEVVGEAMRLGLEVMDQPEWGINGTRSVLIPTSGSKEGWEPAEDHKERIKQLKHWLRVSPATRNSADGCYEWLHLNYGETEDGPVIIDHGIR
jgi:hypothetical protein